MRTLTRIKNIIRSNRVTSLVEFGGDLMKELQKHLATLDTNIALIEMNKTIAAIDKSRWEQIVKQISGKCHLNENDPKKSQSLSRLREIAEMNLQVSTKQMDSFDGRVEEFKEIRNRVVQAISMIEVENNIRSVTAMYDGNMGLAVQTQHIELETREIRRLLHTTDGLMEIGS